MSAYEEPCDCTPVCTRAGHHVGLGRMRRRDRERFCGVALVFGVGPRAFCTKACRDAGQHRKGASQREQLRKVVKRIRRALKALETAL